MTNIFRLAFVMIAVHFIESLSAKTTAYVHADDFSWMDDQPKMPNGKAVRVTVEYCDNRETYPKESNDQC